MFCFHVLSDLSSILDLQLNALTSRAISSFLLPTASIRCINLFIRNLVRNGKLSESSLIQLRNIDVPKTKLASLSCGVSVTVITVFEAGHN